MKETVLRSKLTLTGFEFLNKYSEKEKTAIPNKRLEGIKKKLISIKWWLSTIDYWKRNMHARIEIQLRLFASTWPGEVMRLFTVSPCARRWKVWFRSHHYINEICNFFYIFYQSKFSVNLGSSACNLLYTLVRLYCVNKYSIFEMCFFGRFNPLIRQSRHARRYDLIRLHNEFF